MKFEIFSLGISAGSIVKIEGNGKKGNISVFANPDFSTGNRTKQNF
jgi:hypothetical protein